MTTVLGGHNDSTFDSNMHCQIGFVKGGEELNVNKPFIAIITRGTATANGKKVREGHLIEGKEMSLVAKKQLGLVLITRGDEK